MATDAAILTAARNLSAAMDALKAADAEIIRLGHEQTRAGQIRDEKYKAAKECETRLVQLSAQKPTEPPMKVEPKPLEYVQALPPVEKQTVVVEPTTITPVASGPVPTLSNRRR